MSRLIQGVKAIAYQFGMSVLLAPIWLPIIGLFQ